ncbi:DUF459 domain-containing protein [Fundidesulfovibrio terrae]|uniref:DUF459 domain-containing protein n=1 Tax=Fundidesulfovibrio terrae TaxID=2922866 RepID=UPI001FB01CBA|nr:DUF459 domain-containing protein [Fundidesulfovibrio terrae]
MTGKRIVLVYALALAVGVALLFDRIGPWLSGKFPDGLPEGLAAVVAAGESLHAASGLTGLALALDCSTAGMFDGTYKKTYRCGDAALADAAPPSSHPGEALAAQDIPDAASGTTASLQPGQPPQPKLNLPANVLVVGDSLAVTLAVSLEKAFKDFEGLTMIPKGKIASGLQNPQYYNWEQALSQFMKEYDPQLVIVMMGANDAKYLSLDPEAPEPAALDDRRRFLYEARLKKFLSVMDERKVTSYWIGLPVMGDPELSGKSRALNAIVSRACRESSHGRFLDTWPLLCDPQGNYAQHIMDNSGHRIRVREGDKIHFSTAGGDIIVRALLKDAGELIEFKPKGGKQVAQAPTAARTAAQ